MFGLNIDPRNPAGNPEPSVLRDLGVQIVRYSFKVGRDNPMDFYEQRVRALHNEGIRSLIILTNESLREPKPLLDASDYEWDNYITKLAEVGAQIASRFGSFHPALQIWNEPDISPQRQYNPTLPQMVFARMLHRLYQAIKNSNPSVEVVSAGLASGIPSWMKKVIDSLHGEKPFDILAVHPYTKQPERGWPSANWGTGYTGDLLTKYWHLARMPIWVSEISVMPGLDMVRGEYLRRFYQNIGSNYSFVKEVMWFCYADGMVPPFGLINRNGDRKASWNAYKDLAQQERAFARPAFSASPKAGSMRLMGDGTFAPRPTMLEFSGSQSPQPPHEIPKSWITTRKVISSKIPHHLKHLLQLFQRGNKAPLWFRAVLVPCFPPHCDMRFVGNSRICKIAANGRTV